MMYKTFSRYLLFSVTLAIASSCKVTTEPVASKLVVPETYDSANHLDTAALAAQPWKLFYQDTVLIDLVQDALENNFDLKSAKARVSVEVADLNWIKRNLLPSVNATVSTSVDKFGDYTMNGVGNDDTNRSETLSLDKRLPSPYTEWFAGLLFNWEADIWGKLSNRRKAAMARYLASREFTHGVTTWLISEVATNYYELIGLDQEKKVLEQNLKLQELGLELIQIQKAGGKVNQLAVDQFEAQLLNTRTQLVSVEQNILRSEAQLNQLLGRFPEELTRRPIARYDTIVLGAIGTPEHLLQHRPDIRQAEQELTAAHANVNVARAAFYPSLVLSGGVGFSAFDLSKLVLMPASSMYQAAAGLSAPVFQRRQIRSLYEAANAKQRIALNKYEQRILAAYYEVYVALKAFQNLNKQIELKQNEVRVLTRAFNNCNDLFSVGYATYLEVITSQRRMLEEELELTRLKKEKLKSMAVLYRALGGGWQ